MKAMIFLMSLAVFIAALHPGYAQKKKKGTYKLWVERINREPVEGRLLELKDSTVLVGWWETGTVEEIQVKEVKRMKFRRKGAIGKGAAIGAGAGLALGLITGFASGDDEPGWFSMTAEEKSVGSAVLLTPVGAAVGAVVGSARKKFVIEGKQDNYEKLKTEMAAYLPNP